MTLPVIAALAASVLAVLQAVLMLTVGNKRRADSVAFGDGGDVELLRLIRRHGNLIENAPMFLILLALLEILGGSSNVVITLAVVFVLARFSHALALSGPAMPLAFRIFGALGTLVGLLGTAGFLAYTASGML